MIGIKELLIVLVVVLLVFGTKKIRNLGGDLGSSIKDFKKALNEGEKESDKSLDDKSSPEDKDKPQI